MTKFTILALACPEVLCRLLGYVAQRSNVIDKVDAERHGKELRITILVDGFSAQEAQVLAEKMSAIVTVDCVAISRTENGRMSVGPKSGAGGDGVKTERL